MKQTSRENEGEIRHFKWIDRNQWSDNERGRTEGKNSKKLSEINGSLWKCLVITDTCWLFEFDPGSVGIVFCIISSTEELQLDFSVSFTSRLQFKWQKRRSCSQTLPTTASRYWQFALSIRTFISASSSRIYAQIEKRHMYNNLTTAQIVGLIIYSPWTRPALHRRFFVNVRTVTKAAVSFDDDLSEPRKESTDSALFNDAFPMNNRVFPLPNTLQFKLVEYD